MFSRKKEDEDSLPDLPPLKSDFLFKSKQENQTQDDFDEVLEKHNLPSFPDSPSRPGFAQAAIKDAIKTEESQMPEPVNEDELPVIPGNHGNFQTIEMEEWSPRKSIPQQEEDNEDNEPILPSLKEKPEMPFMPSTQVRGSDIFVKIEKFRSAKQALAEAQDNLEEIEDLLRKIRETKMREEQELSSWENELESIRTKIKNVTSNIFEKTD